MVGGDGVKPPEPYDNRFTVCPAITYGITAHIIIYGESAEIWTPDTMIKSHMLYLLSYTLIFVAEGQRIELCKAINPWQFSRLLLTIRQPSDFK